MYDISNKQYIIKQTSGKTLNIFNKPNTGIFLSYLNKKGTWTDPVLITKDILPGYSICSDSSDRIHLLCQDRQGNIKYMIYDNEKWNSKTILRSRSFSPYDKHLCIMTDEKNVHFFYTLQYSEKNLLSYQVLKSTGELSDPKVIDYVPEAPNPYILHKCLNGDLYLFYTYQDSKFSRVGYKKFTVSRNAWSDFSPITDFNGESNIVACTSDAADTLYTCWHRRISSNYEFVISTKKSDSPEWNKEILISKSAFPFANSSMIVLENEMIVYWFKESSIMYSSSIDNGNTWSTPKVSSFVNNDQIHCISYICNTKDDKYDQHFSIHPGILNSGYELAFSVEKAPEVKSLAAEKSGFDDFQPTVLNSLKTMSCDIEAIKKLLADIDAKLDALENKQRQLEVELDRNNSKFGITDSELTKIKSLLTDIKQINENTQANMEHKPTPLGKSRIEGNTESNLNNHAPIMPGSGFASITPEFLRSLQKK